MKMLIIYNANDFEDDLLIEFINVLNKKVYDST